MQESNEQIVYVGGKDNSNIYAELIAIRESLKWGLENIYEKNDESEFLEIITDSKYSVDCMVSWRSNWQNPKYVNQKDGSDFKIPIKTCLSHWNLINEMWNMADALVFKGIKVEFKHVRGHGKDVNMSAEDIHGNEQADIIATEASMSAALGNLIHHDLGYNSQSETKLRLLSEL